MSSSTVRFKLTHLTIVLEEYQINEFINYYIKIKGGNIVLEEYQINEFIN